MPTNVLPEWYKQEERVRNARTTDEKIIELEKLISITPSHKGCENLRAQLRSKLAKLKSQRERQTRKSKKTLTIQKEGAGQVCIIGLANSGKSELLKALTGVGSPSVQAYSTKKPEVGMMLFEDVQIQIIEIPSTLEPGYLSIAHTSNLNICLIDLTQNKQKEILERVVKDLRLKNVIWVGNKLDLINSKDLISISAKTGAGLDKLKNIIWNSLNLIRVYTNHETRPLTMPIGSTVKDVAEHVHKDFVRNFKFARVWGSTRFPGAQVGLGYVLKDKDIVEIHIK